jgi:hypothetical protein
MTPMTTPSQITLVSHVEVSPTAATSTWRYMDYWGSQVTVFDLHRPHQQMRITATSMVETSDPDPVFRCRLGRAPLAVHCGQIRRAAGVDAPDHGLASFAGAGDRGHRRSTAPGGSPRPRLLGTRERGVRTRLHRGTDRCPGGVGPAQGRVPGHRPPDRRTVARRRHPSPVRLRALHPSPTRITARPARRSASPSR